MSSLAQYFWELDVYQEALDLQPRMSTELRADQEQIRRRLGGMIARHERFVL